MAFGLGKIIESLKGAGTVRPAKVVGIDFGSSSIKVVELEQREEVIALSTYGELQLGPYANTGMGSTTKLDTPKRIEALVDVLREAGVDAKSGVTALPLPDSFVTVMTLTARPDEDITSRVPVEARKYIPVPLTDVALEWSEVPRTSDPGDLNREILLAAIQNEALLQIRQVLGAIHMDSQPLEIELFSTLRAAAKQSEETLAIIDVGAQMSKLYVIEGGFLHRIHRVRAGGTQATEALSRQLGIGFEDAENLKRNYIPDQKYAVEIKKVMAGIFDRPFQEFKRVISQHENRMGKPIGRIVLTGGSSLFYDFVSYASYMLDTEVALVNPFTKVAYPAFMEDTLTQIGPVFATALGAALRSFEQ
jgi:type IV pilus assembly protein PilM